MVLFFVKNNSVLVRHGQIVLDLQNTLKIQEINIVRMILQTENGKNQMERYAHYKMRAIYHHNQKDRFVTVENKRVNCVNPTLIVRAQIARSIDVLPQKIATQVG